MTPVSSRNITVKWRWFLLALAATVLLPAAYWNWLRPVAPVLERALAPQLLSELLALPPREVERCDIALVNLLCAEGLPGAGAGRDSEYLATLDRWALRVRSETKRNLYRFRANPAEYENSEAYFRMLMMAVVLYEDFGVRYNPERIALPSRAGFHDRFFADSRDIFLHGLLGERRMGTCSSMPVLYIAVGRRLGYPLKLVTTKAHLFIRWEDTEERFNLEATGRGMNRYGDEHFKQWPFAVTDAEVHNEGYLKSLSASEELAIFLSLRGNCLKEHGKLLEASECYAAATRLAPGWRAFQALLADANQPPSPTAVRIEQVPNPKTASLPPRAPAGARTGPVTEPNPLTKVGSASHGPQQ